LNGDPDGSVRFQLALALKENDDSRVPPALADLLERDDSHASRLAILCAIGKNPWPFMREISKDADFSQRHAGFLEQVARQCGSEASDRSITECLEWITADSSRATSAGGLATLAGLSRGLFDRGRSLRDPSLSSGQVLNGLQEIVLSAIAIAHDSNQPVDNRARAAVVAANAEPATVETLAIDLIQPFQPQALQTAAVWAIAQMDSLRAWHALFDRWAKHTTATRQAMLDQAPRSTTGADALISALEADILAAEELPASTREVLGQLKDQSLRDRVQPILAEVTPADRAAVVARFADVATRRGDALRGAQVFKQKCQTCHAMQGVGQKVGPDLASVASRRAELLIADIFDPSQQVTPDYVNYLVVTKDGKVLNGVIAGETAESVTLRREEGQQDTISRGNIEELRASGKSIMPDGLEEKLTPDQLADLLEFLRQPDASHLN
jgi:putative heme-binding domain-containing protein